MRTIDKIDMEFVSKVSGSLVIHSPCSGKENREQIQIDRFIGDTSGSMPHCKLHVIYAKPCRPANNCKSLLTSAQ